MIRTDDPGSRVLVAKVVGVTVDGDLVAKPSDRSSDGPSEIILSRTIPRRRRFSRAGGIGDRVLVRLDPTSSPPRTGHILSLLPHRPERFVGVVVSAHDAAWRVEIVAASLRRRTASSLSIPSLPAMWSIAPVWATRAIKRESLSASVR